MSNDESSRKPRERGGAVGRSDADLVALFRRPAAVLDGDGRVAVANGAFDRLVRASEGEAVGAEMGRVGRLCWSDDELEALEAGLDVGRTTLSEFEVRASLETSGQRILKVSAQPLARSEDGGGQGRVLVEIEDVTERRRIAEHLHLQRTAMRSAANAIFITDREGRIEWANPACERLSGYVLDEITGENPRIFKSGKQTREYYRELWETLLSGTAWSGRVTNRHKDGGLYTVEQTVTPIVNRDGGVTHFVAIHEDITARLESEQRIAHLARHDFLTDLPNRFALDERLDLELSRAARFGRSVVVMCLDLDRFKDVNDTFGHAVGDRLLIAVAGRLKARRRDIDLVARLGGDEFAIVLVDVDDAESVIGIAEGILADFESPFDIESRPMYVNASIGIGVYSQGGFDKEELLRRADLALYEAKGRGGNSYEFYAVEMDGETRRRVSLGQDLNTAVADGGLFLEYQPQVDLTSEQVVGVEALLRWRHPDFGLVGPSEFVPIAESSGLITPIGEWVLRTACEQAAAWRAKGIRPLPVAVNVSAVQLRDPGFPDLVADTLRHAGLEPGSLELELTERVLMDSHPVTEESLKRIHEMGVKLSLDDFGKGYASLDYLRRYPLHKLKIDRSFVHDIETNDKNATIVGAVIELAARLDLQVIAEGVEPEDLLEHLIEQGCREVQGFYFSRPVPAEEIEQMLLHGVLEKKKAGSGPQG